MFLQYLWNVFSILKKYLIYTIPNNTVQSISSRVIVNASGPWVNYVLDSYAGLMVLARDKNSAFKRSHETIIHYNHTKKPHVFSIYGEKLTMHRTTAQKLAQIITRYLS